MWAVGRDERYWKDPNSFNPDRFLDSEGKFEKLKAVESLSFGGGKRRCVGEQLGKIQTFLTFTRLLQKCNFSKVPGEIYTFEAVYSLILDPQDYRVIVQERL